MGSIHTHFPSGEGYSGEGEFARRLAEFSRDGSHYWFSPNLAGVFDIDVLMYDELVGFFAIEVKAISLGMIAEYSAGVCRIKGRPGTGSPLRQVRQAKDSLVAYLRDVAKVKQVPFVYITAAFPKIKRADFLEVWDSVPVRAQAEGMIFQEDLESADLLRERLQRAVKVPPLGGPPRRKPDLPYPELERVVEALSQHSAVRPARTDLERIRQIAAASAKPRADKMREYVRLSPGREVRFTGPPGTGKTNRLLEVGLAHAAEGNRVLFTCFNKVLRSEISRLLAASLDGRDAISLIDIIHVHGLEVELKNGAWDTKAYQTILIDEAQDLAQDMFEMLKTLATPETEWLIADGEGQELYKNPHQWLTDFQASAEEKRETYRYRSAGSLGLFAGCVRTNAPDIGRVDDWLSKRDKNVLSGGPGGQLPLGSMELPDMPELVRASDQQRATKEGRRTFLKEILQRELSRLDLEGRSKDLAILVPKKTEGEYGAEAAWVRDVLAELQVPYMDQIASTHRLEIVPPGTVRLVTMHSARGIEASRVLVLGLDRLGGNSFGDHQQQCSLAYIALSRAHKGLTVVSIPIPGSSPGTFVEFTEYALDAIRKLADT